MNWFQQAAQERASNPPACVGQWMRGKDESQLRAAHVQLWQAVDAMAAASGLLRSMDPAAFHAQLKLRDDLLMRCGEIRYEIAKRATAKAFATDAGRAALVAALGPEDSAGS